jgi:hypothetical protein
MLASSEGVTMATIDGVDISGAIDLILDSVRSNRPVIHFQRHIDLIVSALSSDNPIERIEALRSLATNPRTAQMIEFLSEDRELYTAAADIATLIAASPELFLVVKNLLREGEVEHGFAMLDVARQELAVFAINASLDQFIFEIGDLEIDDVDPKIAEKLQDWMIATLVQSVQDPDAMQAFRNPSRKDEIEFALSMFYCTYGDVTQVEKFWQAVAEPAPVETSGLVR